MGWFVTQQKMTDTKGFLPFTVVRRGTERLITCPRSLSREVVKLATLFGINEDVPSGCFYTLCAGLDAVPTFRKFTLSIFVFQPTKPQFDSFAYVAAFT